MTELLQISQLDQQTAAEVLENYEEQDLDAIVYTGDNQHLETAGQLGEELEADVYNVGQHVGIEAEEFAEEVEDFDPEEDEVYEHLLESSGAEDLTAGRAEIGDVSLVGGFGGPLPEIDDYEADDLYEEEELEELASELEGDQQDHPVYDWLKSTPWESVNSVVETIGELLGYEDEGGMNPDEIELDEIPEELRNEQHEAYLEQKERLEEAKEARKEKLEQNLTEAGSPIIAVESPINVDEESEDWGKALEENDVEAIAGIQSEADEIYGARVVESGENYTHISYGDESLEVGQPATDSQTGQEQTAEETEAEVEAPETDPEELDGEELVDRVSGFADEAGIEYTPETEEEAEAALAGMQINAMLMQQQMEQEQPETPGEEENEEEAAA